MLRKLIGMGFACVCALQANTAVAQEFSANIGWNSEYLYRGIPQKDSSVFAAVDLETDGFYLGAWGGDVGDGIEVDYYGGYGFEVGSFGFSIGATLYTYTGNFDDTYKELNLGVSWNWLSLDMAAGKWDNFGQPALSYQFYSLSAEHMGLFGTIGLFEDGFDGVYYEAGFAEGLGIPVIRTVRKDSLGELHFDTRQYNHIVYESQDELRVKLKNRIMATIPNMEEPFYLLMLEHYRLRIA